MVSCLATAAYTMLADVWDQVSYIDEDTNERVRGWKFMKTIKCRVIPYVDGGIHGAGTGEEFSTEYDNLDYARLKSQVNLNKRQRIKNVRHARTGQVLWADEEDPGSPGTVFNVNGCTPLVNPLTGRINEYLSILSRAEVRD